MVDSYVYLWCKFNYNGNFHRAIAKQISQAKKAYYSLIQLVLPVLYIVLKYGDLQKSIKLKYFIENSPKNYWMSASVLRM